MPSCWGPGLDSSFTNWYELKREEEEGQERPREGRKRNDGVERQTLECMVVNGDDTDDAVSTGSVKKQCKTLKCMYEPPSFLTFIINL